MSSIVDDLDAQIAALQAKRDAAAAKDAQRQKIREREEAKILVGSTPVKGACVPQSFHLPFTLIVYDV
jgi:uncharacterized protein YlxW (UPF0749 family)